MMKPTNRREFFKHATKFGLAGGVGALVAQAACVPGAQLPFPIGDGTQPTDGTGDPNAANGTASESAVPEWPWTYTKLDPEAVRKRAYKGYFDGHCAYGAFEGIVGELADLVGHPFDKIPTMLFLYGAGGVAGFASLCGACNGACAAISLVNDEPTTMKLAAQLLSWYSVTALPTDISNEYAQNHEFPVEGKTDIVLPKSVSGSELCHASVTNWCTASGYASGAPERSERCGRLCADTAARAIELLNAQHDGVYDALTLSPLPADASGCRACHSKGENYALGQFTRGKTDCRTCHVSPTLSPH